MSDSSEMEQIYATFIQDVKEKTVSKLKKDHDWMDQMRLKCKAYIKNNGTKIISVQEISDHLAHDAIESFPKHLKQELGDEIQVLNDKLFSIMLPDIMRENTLDE